MTRATRLILRLMAMLFLLATVASFAAASEPTASESIDLLEKAVSSIGSFDVEVKIERTVLPAEKTPKTFVTSYRQVFQDKKSRFELKESPEREHLNYTLVFDGETERILNSGQRASIRPRPERFVQQGEDYLGSFRNYYGPETIVNLLRKREGNSVSRISDENFGDLICIESPVQKEGPYSSTALRIVLDPQYGNCVRKIEARINTSVGPALRNRITNERFSKLPGGGWAPLESVYEAYGIKPDLAGFGKVVSTVKMTVDEQKSKWNEKIDDRQFELEFPKGTQVANVILKTSYVSGGADDPQAK